jgi:hypothetical protein
MYIEINQMTAVWKQHINSSPLELQPKGKPTLGFLCHDIKFNSEWHIRDYKTLV